MTAFQRAYPPTRPAAGPALWFVFQKDTLLMQEDGQGHILIQTDEADMAKMQPRDVLYIGTIAEVACMACEMDGEQALPQGWQAVTRRALFGLLDDAADSAAGYAFQLLNWQRTSRYCPVCGAPNGPLGESWGRQCPQCGHLAFPPVIPAVLALVHRDEHLLMANAPGRPRYSILAGFVEPGETLEECVRREVMEEVGVEIADVTYISSQSWPYPTQLMVGFHARYISGELRPQPGEIEHAAWFHVDELPNLPPPLSLSYELIVGWAKTLRPERDWQPF